MHDLLLFTGCGSTSIHIGYNSDIENKKTLVIKAKAFK